MTFVNDYLLHVDIKKRVASQVPIFRQGDTARLRFRVYDSGRLFDLSGYTRSEIAFGLPSGKTFIADSSLEDGLIVYEFFGIEMSEIGSITVMLSVYSNETVVSVQPFKIHVYDNMRGEEVTYITILQDLVAEVTYLQSELNPIIEEVWTIKNNFEELHDTVEENEVERYNNELDRVEAEGLREDAEVERELNEDERITKENLRISAENARISAESTRQSNESTRQANESNRVINTNLAIDRLNTAMNNFDYKGVFNPSTTYVKHNVVGYNGSSYSALKTVIGITPTDDGINWQLIAQRGVDGEGSVKSVNGTLPDLSGDVAINEASFSQSGLMSPSEKMKLSSIEEGANNTNVVDTLESDSTTSAVSAKQAKVLKGLIDGKASSSHSHGISDITGLQSTLDEKASSSHTHSISNVTGLQSALDGKASSGHGHSISDVYGLQTALNSKATTATFTSTLSTSWTGSSAPFTQEITISGILDSDTPFISVVYDDDNSIAQGQNEAWNMIGKCSSEPNKLVFTCFTEKPTVAIPIQIKVVR